MENLDDLPTGGRVTRSLRKRLNSVDSEASSSRCATPTNQKLPSITEVSIASSRTTRANTPVKTPSKGRGLRGVTPDINSPAKRLTRRSSISIIEDEHPKTNGKEIELEALQEEGSKSASKSKTPQTKPWSASSSNKRVTRRNSVVIFENEEIKEENLETLSDVSEVISVSNSEDVTTSATKENALKSGKVQTSSRVESASPTKTVVKSPSEQLNSDVQIINLMSDDSSREVDFVETENDVELKPVNANDTSKQEQNETAIESEKEKPQEKNKSNTSPKISTEVVYIKKLKQSDIARYTNKPTETVKEDQKDTKSVTEITKSVSLNASDDDTEKKKYPKTPAITKSKSYIENNLEKDTVEEEKSFTSDRKSHASLKLSKDDTESNANEPNSSKESLEFHDATDVHMDSDHENNKEDVADPCKTSFSFAEKTPYKTKLSNNVKSSTPFVETVTADKKIELRERQKGNNEHEIKNIKENGGSDEDVHNKSGNSSKHSFELDPELLTPEKCLRSGKTYGSTPPLISPRESPSLHNKSTENKAEKEKSTSVSTANETSKNSNESVEEKVVEDKTTETCNKSMNKEENSNKKDKSISDAQVVGESTESKANDVPFTRSWSPSVCGKADAAGQKIDTITDTTEVKEKVGEIIEDKTNFNTSTTERFHYEPDNDDEEEPTNVNENADDDDDDSDDEEKEKNEFIDSEAEEAPKDYQSGDSMDEEERKDMEENGIPIDGESIGSEDTDEEDAEDDDASKDSFIVEDEEVDLLEYSDDDEYMVESKKSKSKRSSGSFRRIMVPSSDSDSDQAEKEIPKSKTNTRRQSITGKSKAALTLDVTKMIDDSMTDDDDAKNASKIDEGETEVKLNGQEEKDLKDDESLRLVATEESDSESMETLSISKSFNQSQSGRKSDRNVLDSTDKNEKSAFKETLKKFLNTSNRTSNVSQSRDESDGDKDGKRSTDVAAASKESEEESDSVEEKEENDQQEVLEAEKKAKTVEVENDEESDDDEDKDEEGVDEKEEDDEDLAENEEEEEDEVVAEEEEEEEVVEALEEDEDTKEKNKEDDEVEEDDKGEKDVEEDGKEEDDVGEDDDEDIEEKEEDEVGKGEDEVEKEEDLETKEESIEQDKENSIRRKKKNKKGAFEQSNDSQNETKESEEEPGQDLLKQQPTGKKRKSAGLSVSFDHKTTSNKVYEVVEENMYSSFTIGVKVTKKPQKSLKKDKITIETAETSISDATSNVQQLLSSDEEEHLEKLKGNEQITINKRQRRLTLNTSDGSVTSVKRRKLERNSICLPIDEEMPISHSFTETISKRKSTIRQQQLPTSIDEENVTVQKEGETSTEQTKESSSSTSGSPMKINAAKKSDNSIQNILSRCDEILGAANEAKLEAKRNFKKSKVRQRKKQSNKQTELASTSTSADTSETTEMDESLEKKRKEEVKNAVEQALKASVNILLNPPDKKKIKHQTQAQTQTQNTIKSEEEERKLASKRLPDDILAAIAKDEPEREHEHISHVVKKKKQTVAHKEQENLGGVKKINSIAGEFIEGPLTPTKKKMSKIETATGPFLVEPLTPKHKTNISGFRESPITPRTIGFKVRQILTAGQDTPPILAASTSSSSSSRARKRGRNIEEPTHTLPRTIWTNSGGFVEQDIRPTRHINVSGCATQFSVSALKGSTKSKKIKTNSNAAINASALQFKETALMRSNAKRESSRELLLRKQRLNEHRSNKHV